MAIVCSSVFIFVRMVPLELVPLELVRQCNGFCFASGKVSSAHQTCNVIYYALYLHAMIIADTNTNFVQHIDH